MWRSVTSSVQQRVISLSASNSSMGPLSMCRIVAFSNEKIGEASYEVGGAC